MNGRRITRSTDPPDISLDATPSKSVTHRAHIAAALASGVSLIHRPLIADDSRVTRHGLQALGIRTTDSDGVWSVEGCGGRVPGGGEMSLEESGSSLRFLLAVAALGSRPTRLDGAPRLRERPVQELARALRELGGTVRLGDGVGGLPLDAGGSAMQGGSVRIRAGQSSQFASALLLIGPHLPGGLDLTLEADAVSLPYVTVTTDVLSAFGVDVAHPEPLRWSVGPCEMAGRDYTVEGDYSSASYFLAAAAILGGRVRINGLSSASAQPDSCLGPILRQLGCEVDQGPEWIEVRGGAGIPAFDLNMADAPDLVPTLAVLALFSDGPCRIHGVAHLRIKESDRLAVLAQNLIALGREARTTDDGLEIGPPAVLSGADIVTASDHRMAMAFALAGLRLEGVVIDDAGCVAKSNPRFWSQFEKLER